ncbi:MAG: hypothetical protein AAFO62_11210, partial [Pseudomonadota bacterium]
GRQTVFVANLKAGAIDFRAGLAASNAAISGASLKLQTTNADGKPSGTTLDVGMVDDGAVILPAGTYFATAERGQLRETIRLDVAAGANQVVGFELPGAQVTVPVSARETQPVTIRILEKRTNSSGTETFREVDRTTGTSGEFFLPDATYRFEAQQAAAVAARDLTLVRGDVKSLPLSLRTGLAKLSTDAGGALNAEDAAGGITYRIWREGAPQETAETYFGPRHDIRLVPGRYVVQSRIGAPFSSATVTMVIAADQVTNAVVRHAVGRVALRARGRSPRAFWEIINANGRKVWRGMGQETEALLPAGTYTVRAWTGRTATAPEMQTITVTDGGAVTAIVDTRE